MIAYIGCIITPTARSEKARLITTSINNIFRLVDIDEAFHRAQVARIFLMVVKGESEEFATQRNTMKDS